MISLSIKNKLKEYFEVDEFKQLLRELKKKYINYGSCIGTISVKPENNEEALKLSKFLAKNIKCGIKVNIKIRDIQKSLDDSIFEGITVDELVKTFFPNIKSNKEIKIETNKLLSEKFAILENNYKDSDIKDLFSNSEAIKRIKYLIINDEKLLINILASLVKLPIFSNDVLNLAIFASRVTGKPHYYDLDTHNSNQFIQFICWLLKIDFDNSRSTKKMILEKVGIIVDEVSNFAITYNLSGNDMVNSFKENLTPLTLNIANIRKMKDLYVENGILLIIENPSFLSRIIDRKINCSVIITSSNSNLVIYKLLDKIKWDKIFFNGDFDPEGLLIAQNFKNRYKDLVFIGYSTDYYSNGISDNKISDVRLKKLDNIVDTDLVVIKELIKLKKLASYQEANYDRIIKELKIFD